MIQFRKGQNKKLFPSQGYIKEEMQQHQNPIEREQYKEIYVYSEQIRTYVQL